MSSRTPLRALVIGAALLASCKRSAPSVQCKTALLETTSCRGEDTSFQECRYFFRAEGTPEPAVCRAFASSAEPDAGAGGCDERSPRGWARVPCGEHRLPVDWACYTCTSARPEETRRVLQAFAPSCERSTVLKTCNADLARAAGL